MTVDGAKARPAPHRTRLPFRFFERLADALAAGHMRRRARRNLAAGFPQLAVFAFDYIGQEVSLRGLFEADELTALFDFLSPLEASFRTRTALDIGANIGNHSLFLARRFSSVHAFEPNPETFRLLEFNARLAPNVTPHRIGLGAERGRFELAVDPLNIGEAKVLESGASPPAAAGPGVDIERLDDLAEGLGSVAFVKVDVEGHEPQVFRGGRQFLGQYKPIVAFEQNEAAFVGGRSQAIELLRQLGYAICVMTKRDSGGLRMLAPLRTAMKMLRGIRFEIEQVDEVAPGTYPMLLAIDPALLERLSTARSSQPPESGEPAPSPSSPVHRVRPTMEMRGATC